MLYILIVGVFFKHVSNNDELIEYYKVGFLHFGVKVTHLKTLKYSNIL
jgi:hypothetical protein